MKKNLKRILIYLLCCVMIVNVISYDIGKNNKVYAVAWAIPAGTILWDIVGSLFVTAMGYCLYDSVNNTVMEKIESTYDISSGLTREEYLEYIYPQNYIEKDNIEDLLANMFNAGAFLTVPDLNDFVGKYINRSEADNPVLLLEEYFGSALVNGEKSDYLTSLGDAKLMSYSTTAGTNGLLLTQEALLQLIRDLGIGIDAYISMPLEEACDETIIDDAITQINDTYYDDFNEGLYNREAYGSISVPAVPDITTDVLTNQEYIIFSCKYSINYESMWIWCLTWAEPEGYNAAQYLRGDCIYGLENRNAGQWAPSFYFDTCATTSYPHTSGCHTSALINAGLDFNMYGLKNGEWVLQQDFTSAVTGKLWYNYTYDRFDYNKLLYTSVGIPIRTRIGVDTYEHVENFHKVYELEGMRTDADILGDKTESISIPTDITADYILVDENTGVTTMDSVNSIIKENVITGVVDDDVEDTIAGVIDVTNEEAAGIIADESVQVVTGTIEEIKGISTPLDGNFSDFMMPEGILRKFPFCIPFDLIATVQLLAADPVVPRWEVPFVIESLGINEIIVIDLSAFSSVAAICRWCETIAFIIFLILQTRKLI